MSDKLLEELETKVVTKAIKLLNVDKLADQLSKQLSKKLQANFDEVLDGRLDIADWLMDELVNNNTKAGKKFNEVIAKIAKKMADAV